MERVRRSKEENNKKVKTKSDILLESSELDDMDFLDKLVIAQNECAVKGCKEKNVSLYGSICKLCNQRVKYFSLFYLIQISFYYVIFMY